MMPRGETYQDYRVELEEMEREVGEIARDVKPLPRTQGCRPMMPTPTARPNAKSEWSSGRSSTFGTFYRHQPPRTKEHNDTELATIKHELIREHHRREPNRRLMLTDEISSDFPQRNRALGILVISH